MFFNRMTQALAHCRQSGDFGTLLFIDLDNFKTLNDTQGHDVGDALLVQVAARLKSCVSPRDLVARIGGDEFVVVIEDAAGDEGNATLRGITVGNRVVAELNRGFDIGNLHHVGSASIGVVVFDGSHVRPDEIIKRADIAMYQAKSAGRNGLALFDPETMTRESERLPTGVGTAHRLCGKSVRPPLPAAGRFQRQGDGGGGARPLAHPTKGLIRPQRFVSLAEQNGMNDDLTRQVFNQGFCSALLMAARPHDGASAPVAQRQRAVLRQ